MSNTPTNTGDIFAAFIEADKAIKELPAVREELASTKVDLELTKEERAAAQSKAELLAGTIDTLRAELAQKEAELASATFRESQLKFVVDTIRGALPEPVVPTVAKPEQPLITEPQEDITNASMDPTPVQFTTNAYTSTIAEANTESASTLAEPASEASSTHMEPTEVANTATPSPLPTASHGPMESSTPVHDGFPVGQASPTTSQHDADGLAYQHQNAPASAHKPYLGWSYWERPDHITVERFAELGGIVPSWMLPSHHNVG